MVTIPVDVTGAINTTARLTGTLDQPEVAGNIVFADGTFNQQKLSENIAGDYSYQNQKLNFNITKPESIQIAATIPYPIQPQVNDRVTADIKLTTEAFTLLGALTENDVTWMGGEGNAEIVAKANIALNQDRPLDNIEATGKVNLDQAQVKIADITETLTATGNITLNDQIIDVESFNATIGNKDLSVTGKFPLLYAVNNIENPLTINIPPGEIELKELYQGGLAGNIILTGTAGEPVISGELALEDGNLSIPQNKEEQDPETSEVTNNNINSNSESSDPVFAKDFSVKLDDFRLEEQSLSAFGILQPISFYGFAVNGELNLNGNLDNISQLKGEGTIKLVSGVVDWLTGIFAVVRSRDNLIVFNPNKDITNPYLDLEFRTDVEQFNRARQYRKLNPESNEVIDDVSVSNRTQKIDVRLNIDGQLEDILAAISQNTTDICDLSPDNLPLTGDYTYSTPQLDKLNNCVTSDLDLLNFSAINLSSTPYRSQGEIVKLLGHQSLFLDQKRNDSLLNLAFSQFVFKPIERRFLFEAEDFFVRAGKKIGIDYFRVFPYVEISSKLGNSNLYLRGIYDPNVIRTQSDSTDANNTNQVYESRLEYRLKF